MDGFSPPLFRQMVRDLGTTDISNTIDQLDGVYVELEVYQRWEKKKQDLSENNQDKKPNADIKEPDSKDRAPFIKCTKIKCTSTFHNPATCWMLHPELRRSCQIISSQKSFRGTR